MQKKNFLFLKYFFFIFATTQTLQFQLLVLFFFKNEFLNPVNLLESVHFSIDTNQKSPYE